MLSTEEALARALALLSPTAVEDVPLAEAAGRVLAAPVIATRDQPPFAASAMDGYAVRATDASDGAKLAVVGEVQAGAAFSGPLEAGTAVRIFTGAPVPAGADAILIQENAARDGDSINVTEAPQAGRYIRPAGLDFKAGSEITAPRRLSPSDIALAAAMNAPRLSAHQKPIVHLIATGDELVMPGENPGQNQIITSNNFGVAALLATRGAAPVIQPIASDDKDALITALDRAKGADLIVTLGGASVGDYDLVQQVFGDEGMDLSFYKVAMRPGKPLMAGRVRGIPMIGLPGNPVSSMVLAHLLLLPAMDVLQGLPGEPLPRRTAKLAANIGANGPREHFMRARAVETADGLLVTPFDNQDSSVLSLMAQANALAIHPPYAGPMAAGDTIEVILI
ncbi:MAG: gephyrin-like molybdotransferase Glp [Pikeienuella sp.]